MFSIKEKNSVYIYLFDIKLKGNASMSFKTMNLLAYVILNI